MGFCAFARHYLRNHSYFLFLRVLRCFSSPGSPTATQAVWRDRSRRVSPFGHPRVAGHLPLTAAFRSLSRPSSPPRATGIPHAPFLSFLCPSSARSASTRPRIDPLSGRAARTPSRPRSLSLDFSFNSISLALTSRETALQPLPLCIHVPNMSMTSFSLFSVVPGRLELPTSTLSV